MNRFGPSTLVEAGEQKFLFDAGRGAIQRLAQLKVRWQDVDGVFFTHLHSDHVVGFPDLWLTGWLVGPGRDRPLRVWGPRGTEKMMSRLEEAYDFDIRIRLYDDRAAPKGVLLLVQDISEGVAFEKDGLKITAFEVDHSPAWPAFGYRVDYRGRSVVLSGDTRMSQNLIRQAQGVDLLVLEVASPESFQRAGAAVRQSACLPPGFLVDTTSVQPPGIWLVPGVADGVHQMRIDEAGLREKARAAVQQGKPLSYAPTRTSRSANGIRTARGPYTVSPGGFRRSSGQAGRRGRPCADSRAVASLRAVVPPPESRQRAAYGLTS